MRIFSHLLYNHPIILLSVFSSFFSYNQAWLVDWDSTETDWNSSIRHVIRVRIIQLYTLQF